MKREEHIIKDSFWRYMTNFWSIVVWIAIIYDFKYEHALGDVLSSILVIYIALLTIFVSAKEFERWYENHQGRHPGELFVIGWTVLIVGLLMAKVAIHKEYAIPSEVVATYIAVLSVMAITQKSKTMKKIKK